MKSLDEVNGIELNFVRDHTNDENQNKKDQTTNSTDQSTTTNDDKTRNGETTKKVSSRDKSLMIDKLCRVFFPLFYLAFQGYYFGRYLPDFYRD